MDSIKEIIKTAWLPILGMLFHPIYMVVNAATCGRIGDTELAAFGLGSLTLGIMIISIGTCFSMTVSTLIAISSGAKDKRMCRIYLNRQYYLNTIIYFVCVIPLIFIRPIYSLIG
jgi:Na+-driven multidrug efflux pump